MSQPEQSEAATLSRIPELHLPRERFKLRCGARLVVSRRDGAPVTAVRVHVRGGLALDPAGREGRAYLAGMLADQGTSSHSESELAAILEPAGGEIGGDAAGLSGTIAGVDWKLLLEILCELLTSSNDPEEQVERQKGRLLSRLEAERVDPRAQGARRFRRLVYGDHWLGGAPYGTIESVTAIRAKDLRAHRQANWVASRATISICGDVDPKAVRRLLNKLLVDWKPGTAYEPQVPELPPRAVRVDTFTRKREQVHVYLGHLGIRRKDPDYATLAVMDHVLGTGPGFTNRISRRLRDELGLAYSVHADIHSSAGHHPGSFTAYIGTSPEHLATAVRGFMTEIHRIQDEPVGVEELEVAKSYLLGSFVLGFERASRRAGYMVASEVFKLPDDNLERLPREFAAVTPADVQRVAREHLHPDACCLSAAGPVSKRELTALLTRAAPGSRRRSARR